ncbi:MAG TPA: dihydrolipoyl dehydrogenase [Dehalococcoidia bacterium]|nr:dihydrolipoyl dehydrogenase [Dehalococcoidia bacterium]
MEEIDLVAIGGGTGGYTAAIRARQLGLTAAIIERDKVGGTCLHRGCIPTKAWLHSAEILQQTRHAGTFGVQTSEPALDYAAMRARQEIVVDTQYRGLQSTIAKHKIEVIEGEAKIVSPAEVAVGERRFKVKHIVIATGSQPKSLPGLDPDGERIITSDHLLQRETRPKSIAVIGAGAIGCEFASFFADIGTEVTLVEMMPNVVPLEDEDAGRVLGKAFETRGVNVMTAAKLLADRTRSYDGVVEVTVEHGGEEKLVTAEALLVAVGREAVTEGLGLENTNVVIDSGWVQTGERYRTAETSIYAVGDAIGNFLLAHVAGAEGHIAAEAIAGSDPEPLDYNRVPRITYSQPQVASVGMTVEQAREAGYAGAKAKRFSMKNNAMAIIQGETDGFAKIVYDEGSGRLLGACFVGAHVADLASEVALGRFLEATAWELGTNIHPHPSISEALGDAAQLSAGISIYW